MPIKNYTTTIDVAKTIGEIQQFLTRRGVRRISTLIGDDGIAEGLAFTMFTDYGMRDFELPVRTAGVLHAMQNDPKLTASKSTPEQAARTAWRIARDWLEAQAALIDAELATLDEVMMPYLVDSGSGRTMFAVYRERQLALEA